MTRYPIVVILLMTLITSCGVQPAAKNNEGNELLLRGALVDASRAYELAQVNQPDETIPYFNAGVAYLEAGDYVRAEATLKQALLTAEQDLVGDVYFGLGEAHFRQSEFRMAIDAYRQVLLLRPDDDLARYNLQLAIQRVPTETVTPTVTPTTTSTDEVQDITTTPTTTSTPTPDNPDPQTITPTPSPGAETEQTTREPTPDNQSQEGEPPPMNEEAALELLDDVQQGQDVLYAPSSEVLSDDAVIERDW